MNYFFVLGKNYFLSIAEINSFFSIEKKNIGYFLSNDKKVFFVDLKKINAEEVIKKIGGTIKIGIKIFEAKKGDNKKIIDNFINYLNIEKTEGKFNFGISYYGHSDCNLKPLGMEIKRKLREKGVNCRWVSGREAQLSSVNVEQNKLTKGGVEIVIVELKNKLVIGKTLVVQPFKELSKRDYGRPARDQRSGMLPPKLAQIMINLGRKSGTNSPLTILDPFCGSGTIITEAMLAGEKKIIGADISQKAIKDTQENIDWISKRYGIKKTEIKVYKTRVEKLYNLLGKDSVDAIITEPYLGPQRGKINITKTVRELENLYSKALNQFGKIVKEKGRVVMVWPFFVKEKKNLNPDLGKFKIINPLPKSINNPNRRNALVYGRQGQKVWREIFVLEKKS